MPATTGKAAAAGSDLFLLSLRDRRLEGKGLAAGYSYQHGILRAAALRLGATAEQLVLPVLTSLRWLTEYVNRESPRFVFLDSAVGASDGDLFQALARSVRRGAPAAAIAVTGVPIPHHREWLERSPELDLVLAEGSHAELPRLLGRTDDPSHTPWSSVTRRGGQPATGAGPFQEPPSPYREGAIPPDAAADAGVRWGQADENGFDELLWVDQHSSVNQVVPLLGARLGPDGAFRGRLERLRDAALVRCKPAVEVDVLACDPEEIARLAQTEIGSCTLVVRGASRSWQARAREWWSNLEEAGISPKLRLEVNEDAVPRDDWQAALEHDATAEIRSPGRLLRRPAGWMRQPPDVTMARLQRALEGRYTDVLPYAESALDVFVERESWGERGRQESSLDSWLEQSMGAPGAVFELASPRMEAATSPLFEQHRLEPWSSNGLGGWRLDGEAAVTVIGYSRAREQPIAGRSVLVLQDEDDLQAFLGDADRAHTSGGFDGPLLSPLATLLDVGIWAGPDQDASPTCFRLWVSADGHVRTTMGGRRLGMIGESFDTIRQRALMALNEIEEKVPQGAWPAMALPEWLSEEQFFESCRARPWLGQYVAVPRLLRRLVAWHPNLASRSGLTKFRLSGFPVLLSYDGEHGQDAASGRVLLAQVEGRWHYLFNAADDHALRVTPDMAALFEGLAWAPGSEVLEDWLVRGRGLTPEQARTAISTAVRTLTQSGMLHP